MTGTEKQINAKTGTEIKNTVAITLDGQTATIEAKFTEARAKTFFVKEFKFDGNCGKWLGHFSHLETYLPQLIHKYQGNCVVLSAPQEIIEKYNLEIVEIQSTLVSKSAWYEMQDGRAKIENGSFKTGDLIDGQKITGFGKSWNENGKSICYAYFGKYESKSNNSWDKMPGLTYENGIQEWAD